MSDAFKESNSHVFRDTVTFITGFGVVADQPFTIGSEDAINSNLVTYNQMVPFGGISGCNISGSTWLYDTENIQCLSVTGRKLYNQIGIASIDWDNRVLYDIDSIPVISFNEGGLTANIRNANGNDGIVIDIANRVLSGNWKNTNLTTFGKITTSGFVLAGNAPPTRTSLGTSGQMAISGQKLFICTGSNMWGYIDITPW